MGTGDRPGTRSWLSLGLACWLASSGCSSTGRPDGATDARGLTLASGRGMCVVARDPLVLPDDVQVYIEPQNLLHVGAGTVLAGFPSFAWEVRGQTAVARLSTDAYLGARVDPDGRGTIPRPPTDAVLTTVRAVALDGSRVGVLLADADPDSAAIQKEVVRRLWYAEYEDGRWTPLEPVPLPADGNVLALGSSALVRAGDDLVWAAVEDARAAPLTVLFYRRSAGVWRVEAMPGDGADQAALAYAPAEGVLLAVFAEDPDIPGWQKSVRLYRRAASRWELVRRLKIPAPGTEVVVSLVADASGASVGWVEATPRASVAYARVGITAAAPGTQAVLDDGAEQLVGVSGLPGGPRWLVDHSDSVTGARELRLLGVTGTGEVDRLATLPNPYTGYFAALGTDAGDVLVAGPELDPDPAHPLVRSLLLRLSTTCD